MKIPCYEKLLIKRTNTPPVKDIANTEDKVVTLMSESSFLKADTKLKIQKKIAAFKNIQGDLFAIYENFVNIKILI